MLTLNFSFTLVIIFDISSLGQPKKRLINVFHRCWKPLFLAYFSYKLDRQNRRVSAGFAIQMLFAYLLSYVNDSVALDSSNL